MVDRSIDPATLATLSSGVHFPVVFVYLNWPEGPIRAHSGVGSISFGGHTWQGFGRFGRINVPAESVGLAQTIAEMQIVGYPDELDQYLESPVRGRRAEVWYGCVTQRAGNVLIGQPFQVFTGFMDAMRDEIESEDGGIYRVITISVADGPSQRLATTLHHTDEDQRRSFPDDTAGRLVLFAERRAKDVRWPE